MNDRAQSTLITVGLVAAGAYIVWKYLLPKVTALPGQALTSAQDSMANALTTLFPPATSQPVTGAGIMLPDGSVIPLSAAKGLASFTDTDNVIKASFYYNGQNYRTLGPADSSGTLYAYPT